MSMCRVFSCVIGRGCLLWPVHSLGKTLLAFALLHSVLEGQICLLLQVFLDFLLLHSSPLKWKGHLFWVLVLKGLVGLHRSVWLQLLQHYWSGHRLGLLWYWMACLGNEQRSFCRFWDCIQVVHFRFLLTMMATLPGSSMRNSARGKGHEEGGSAYAKAGSSLRRPPVPEHLPQNHRMISVHFQGKPFNITVIQVYAQTAMLKKLNGSMKA